jgi:hypothetical protein
MQKKNPRGKRPPLHYPIKIIGIQTFSGVCIFFRENAKALCLCFDSLIENEYFLQA